MTPQRTLSFFILIVLCTCTSLTNGWEQCHRDCNCYQLLHLEKDAEPRQVTVQYRKLAKEYHPDRNVDGESMFKAIGEAYEVLKDEQRRADYDTKCRTSTPRPRTRTSTPRPTTKHSTPQVRKSTQKRTTTTTKPVATKSRTNLRLSSCSTLVPRQKQSNLIQCLSATCKVPKGKKFTDAEEANACEDANQKFIKWGTREWGKKACVVKVGLRGRKRDGKHAVCQGILELPKFDLKISKNGYTISGTGGQNAQCDERKDIRLKFHDMIIVPIGSEEARFTLDNVKGGSLEYAWHWRDGSGTRLTASVQNALNHEGTESYVFISRKNGAKEQLWDLWHCVPSSSAYGAAANEYDYGYDENDGWYNQYFGEDEYTEVDDGDDDDLEVELDEMLNEMFMAGYQKGLKGHR